MSKPSLQDARLYLCTDSRRERGDLTDFLEAVLTNGVDIIQLREKNLEAAEELLVLEVFADAARRHRKLFAVNDRADLATAAGADVLHVGQRDLPPSLARGLVGQSMIIGRSSHSVQEARTAAAEIEVDYFCLGPIWATPTKPGRPATTLDPIREVAAAHPARPWFAIGGIEESNIDEVLAAGAERVVVVRAITEAADPGAAAARLSSRLRGQSG